MNKVKLFTKLLGLICLMMVVMLTNSISKPQSSNNQEQSQEQNQEQSQRDIVRRLAEDAPSKITKARRKSSNSNPKPTDTVPNNYTLASSIIDNKATSEGIEVGFTFWMLNDSNANDDPSITEKAQRRTNIKSGNKITQKTENIVVTPRRVSSNTKFSNGDWLRFSLDLPINGYIYIFNREKYIDGTLGEPYLIFPRNIDKSKSDKTVAGKLLFIPNLIDYFEIENTSESNKEKAAEVYYILVSPNPLADIALLKTNESEPISLELFNKYEKFSAPSLKFESQGQVNKAITKIEKLANIDGNETLAEDDPLPQTVYHIAKRLDEPIFFSISAEIKK